MIKNDNIENFEPTQGVVVFKRDSEFYLQTHNILKKEGKYTWAEGKPFQREQLQELAQSLSKNTLATTQLTALLPENVLYYQPSISGTRIIWYLKPGKRFLNFSEDLKLKSGQADLPGLIFAVVNKTIFVFAYKGSAKPTEKTKLYKAPFFNMYADGKVCMGTTSETAKKPTLHEELIRWERRFFGSRFTHISDMKVLAKGFNISIVFKAALTGKKFPEAALTLSNYKTVGGFLKKFLKGGVNED